MVIEYSKVLYWWDDPRALFTRMRSGGWTEPLWRTAKPDRHRRREMWDHQHALLP